MFFDSDKPFAKHKPTSNEPIKPGPWVTAIVSIWSIEILASSRAWSTVCDIVVWWARDANSGTTPPNLTCMDWEAITLESTPWSVNTDAEDTSAEGEEAVDADFEVVEDEDEKK